MLKPFMGFLNRKAGPAKSRGFLVVQSNGGLNQMRAGVWFFDYLNSAS